MSSKWSCFIWCKAYNNAVEMTVFHLSKNICILCWSWKWIRNDLFRNGAKVSISFNIVEIEKMLKIKMYVKNRRREDRKRAERKWTWKTFRKLKVTDILNADIHSQLCLAGFRDSGLSGFANLCGHRIVVRIRRLRISMKARKMNMAAWLSRSRCSSTELTNATKQAWSRVEGFKEIH